MVNSAYVKDFLMRLHLGMQASTGRGETQSIAVSFGSTMKAEIDAPVKGQGKGIKHDSQGNTLPQESSSLDVDLKEMMAPVVVQSGTKTVEDSRHKDDVPPPPAKVLPAEAERSEFSVGSETFVQGAIPIATARAETARSSSAPKNVRETAIEPVKDKTKLVPKRKSDADDAGIAAVISPAAQTMVAARSQVSPAAANSVSVNAMDQNIVQMGKPGAFASSKDGLPGGVTARVGGAPRGATTSTGGKPMAKELVEENEDVRPAANGNTHGAAEGQSGDVEVALAHFGVRAVQSHVAAIAAPMNVMVPALSSSHAAAGVAAKDNAASTAGRLMGADFSHSRTDEPRMGMDGVDKTLVATPSSLEVGLTNGSHGWLKIRAELTDTGSVKAALASSSSAGEQMLHRELPGISTFLEQERLSVSSLVIHHASESSGFLTGMDEKGAGGQQTPGGGAADAGGQDRTRKDGGAEGGPLETLIESHQSDLLNPGGYPGSGWLSVRA